MSVSSSVKHFKLDCESSCDTHVVVAETSYRWTIHNFSMCLEDNGKSIQSPTFSASGSDIKWCLHLYPKGDIAKSQDYVSLYLCLLSDEKSAVRAKYKLSILNTKQVKMIEKSEDYIFTQDKKFTGYTYFVSWSTLTGKPDDYLCDDRLVLFCELKASAGYVHGSSKRKSIDVPECQLSEDFEKLLYNKDFNDVILSTGGQELHVHKFVLSARSPVFAAMFKHEMKEAKLNRVEIDDASFVVLKEIVGFIYTGKAPNLEKMAEPLLSAADKYDLERLKVMCEKALASKLSVNNVCNILTFADRHNAQHLKHEAICFVHRHFKDVLNTNGWVTIEEQHPNLVVSLCRALLIEHV